MKHQNYFSQKEENKKYARKWAEYVYAKYIVEIMSSRSNTVYYNEDFGVELDKRPDNASAPVMLVKEIDSVTAVFEEVQAIIKPKKVCVLNFASYTHPGGMFIEGSNAQEECLCRESTLYPVLNNFTSYYEENGKAKNKALYRNRALYSPNIVFERNNNTCFCDVLTCAAPNYTPGKRYGSVSYEENLKALESRCKYVLDIMKFNQVNIPILGAFGCGVFSQDANTVANIFKTLLLEYNYGFDKIVFAVIPGPNAEAFKQVFSN